MEIIRFATNVAQEVRLKGLEGRLVDSKFGGSQYLFYAQEGVFYVSEPVGRILMDQFRALDVKPGETVEICKAETGNGTGRKTQWTVSVVVADGFATIGEQKVDVSPSTELERKLADSIAVVEARKQAQRAPAATPVEQPAWARALANQTRQLIDVYADALAYAGEKHGNAVKPEDVRAMMTTLFINLSKNGSAANAA